MGYPGTGRSTGLTAAALASSFLGDASEDDLERASLFSDCPFTVGSAPVCVPLTLGSSLPSDSHLASLGSILSSPSLFSEVEISFKVFDVETLFSSLFSDAASSLDVETSSFLLVETLESALGKASLGLESLSSDVESLDTSFLSDTSSAAVVVVELVATEKRLSNLLISSFQLN